MKNLKVYLTVLIMSMTIGSNSSPVTYSKKSTKTIKILPLGIVNQSVMKNVTDSVSKYFPNVVVMKKEDMPKEAWYSPRKRYRADKLIHWMSGRAKENEVWLGITSLDISTTKGTNPDSGIMGLGYMPGNACIISSYRIRNKSNVYKVAIHELGHTLGLPHCKNKECYMRDAEGKDVTGYEKRLCEKCILTFK